MCALFAYVGTGMETSIQDILSQNTAGWQASSSQGFREVRQVEGRVKKGSRHAKNVGFATAL